MAFICNAERSLQKWECVRRLTDVAGVSHNACLGLTLQVLDKLPTIPIDLSYSMPILMMLAYGPESYAYQTWHEDGGETSSLGEEVRASCLVMRKLKWLACGEGIDDSSSDRSASPAHSVGSTVHGSMRCLPSSSCSWPGTLTAASMQCISFKFCSQPLLTGDQERVSPGLWL